MNLLQFLFGNKVSKVALLFCLACNLNAKAQFLERLSNPTVVVNLTHPPTSGFKLNKVAFAGYSENCGDQVIGAITGDFMAANVAVIDRQELNALLQQHNLLASSFTDSASAIAAGKILGPTTFITVIVHTCYTNPEQGHNTEKQYDAKTKKNTDVVLYYSRVTAYLRASVRATDLSTGKVVAVQDFYYSPVKENKSLKPYPEYPGRPEVAQMAYTMMMNDVHRLFLPWAEQRELVYYNDNSGGLNKAFQALKAGDQDQAFELSKQNVETCKNTPKVNDKLMEHAYYNLGVSYMIRGDYDNALDNFNAAAKLRPGEILTDAIKECQKAKELVSSMQQMDQKAAAEVAQNKADNDKISPKNAANTLTNDDIINLVKMKISEAVIIQKIKISTCNFNTSTDALASLTKSGVSDKIIVAMMENSH